MLAWVIPASSDRYPSLSALLQPFYSVFKCLSVLFALLSVSTFSCPERCLISPDLRRAVLSQGAPRSLTWQGALSAQGCWAGRPPRLFCLGDGISASVPVIAFPRLLNYCTDRISIKNSSVLSRLRDVTWGSEMRFVPDSLPGAAHLPLT